MSQHDSAAENDLSYAKTTLGSEATAGTEKVLGQAWDSKSDKIRFDFGSIISAAGKLKPTKRNVLSILSRIFDPLGIISPVLVSMKLLFQELCSSNHDWDDELHDEKKQKLNAWLDELSATKYIEIDRCLFKSPTEGILEYQFHGFADASNKAYSAVVYVLCRTQNGSFARLIASKSRVAPLKTLTIPRLELMSAVLLARLMRTIRSALESQLDVSQITYWLDSKTALCWIQNRGEWKQFVRHRVNEILKLSEKHEWRHCPGEHNVADIGSRGIGALQLSEKKVWWHGPQWLTEGEHAWPASERAAASTEESKAEEKKTAVALLTETREAVSISNIIPIDKFSSLLTLLRLSAWMRRFIYNCRAKVKNVDRQTGKITRAELDKAQQDWVSEAQSCLKQQANFDELKVKFGLVEERGTLKCMGRLQNSDLNIEAQRPIILPRDHRLTNLIILECHARIHHGGVRATLTELRSRFWVPKGRQTVKKILNDCVICKRWQGAAYSNPKTAAMPGFRVREAAPFSKVGIDFTGLTLFVKDPKSKDMHKAYIAIFSCCVTRAVHLEFVNDLSAATFLRALRRFTARRGTPGLIVSDNAKTFKAAAKAINKLQNHPEIKNELDKLHVEWKFNLERAPWWGGFFEIMVGSVKRCLRKVLGNARLTYDELLTILVEIEGTLNSRPLTYEYNETDTETLTPSHLIFGRRIKSLPDVPVEEEEENETSCSRRFRHLSIRLAHFWKRWRNEYLSGLREYHRNKVGERERVVQIGDVVTVFEDNVKRGRWKTAVVEDVVIGKDKVVRGAKIRVITKGNPIRMSRPVQKLYPLEIRCETEKVQKSGVGNAEESMSKHAVEVTSRRNVPRRAAAISSEQKTREMVDL